MKTRHSVRAIVVASAIVSLVGLSAFAATRAQYVAGNPNRARVPVEAFEFGEQTQAAGKLKIELWATSPQLFSPVSMDIDALGRAWVVEGSGYGGGTRFSDGTSIVVVSDSDDDGKADKSHVFIAEPKVRLAPLGIAVFDNVIVLSATPSVIVYTDVNRDAKFDPKIDKREVFLTGFQGGGHDHTLHAVVGSPGGQWYLSYGNKGANVKTKDGRHHIAGCYYGNAGDIGKDSSDGHRYVGGSALRINPDGTGLEAVGTNLRNTHDMVVTSFGDVMHNDNDDPAHCRATWLMEYGNLGYADPMDGSKSWEEVGKPWEEQRPGETAPFGYNKVHGKALRISASHWRENYPGIIPPGDVYGPGSPTGVTFIEGDELGKAHRGTYLACEMVHKAVLSYRPVLKDAQIDMVRNGYFVALKKESKGESLLPTDVVVGTEGAIYLADFHSNTSRRASQASGTIYRITRDDGKPMKRPTVDLNTTDGLFAALANPNAGVRFAAVTKLATMSDKVVDPAIAFFNAQKANPYIQARAIWLLAKLGDRGRVFVENLLGKGNEAQRIVAYRALRLAVPDKLLAYAASAASDDSPSVRREVALSLRDVPFDKCKDILAKLIAGYDGTNRWYLEAIGTACSRKEAAVYTMIGSKEPHANWGDRTKNLAWRLHSRAAVDDLDKVVRAQKPDIKAFRHLIMAYTIWSSEADRAQNEKLVSAWAKLPQFAGEDYQQTINEVLLRDIRVFPPVALSQTYKVPPAFGAETKVSAPAEVVKLAGDAARGKAKAATCMICHKIDDDGVNFGPNLSAWGTQRTIEEIVREMVNPAEKLAHGYEKPVRISGRGHVAEGIMTNYSYHAGSLKIKVMGGQILKLPFRAHRLKIEHLKNHSWMPPASKMGLTDQDVRDIAEYLKTK